MEGEKVKKLLARGKMKKLLAIGLLVLCVLVSSCATIEHDVKDVQSGMGGLDRHVRVMTGDGKVIAEFDGKIDIRPSEGGVVFEYEGKRYAYYNCFIEAVEK